MQLTSPKKSLSVKLISFLGSGGFFGLSVAVLVIEAAWIALSARYPQAFDEQFHLGIIKLYAQQLSPFFAHQPAGADAFGAVTRDPSYLYHYLMSFPYRLIAHFTGDLTIQVISLRFINIGLLASSLYIFRKVLAYTPASQALINTTLFFFVLTPVVPLLGSQINYDNLTVPLTGLAVWLTLRFLERLRTLQVWRWDIIGQLLVLCLLASLVKYAFLPVFVALGLVVIYSWFKYRSQRLRYYLPPSRLHRAALVVGLVVSLGLFGQMYGVNMVRYHTPTPECDQVLSVQQCQAYSPWARNYNDEQHKTHLSLPHIAEYPFSWLYHSMGELVFTVASGFNDSGDVDYWVGSQLIVIEILAWGVFAGGVGLGLVYGRRIWRHESLRLFLVVSLLYCGALGAQNFLDFLRTGQPVAVHGRYLLPILPLVYLIIALVFRKALGSFKLAHFSVANRKLSLAGATLVLLLVEGGGFVTYIVRSDPSWFWPQSSHAQTVNSRAQKLLKPLVLDIKKKQ